MKGFIEVNLKNNIKVTINVKYIAIFKDNKIRLNSDEHAITVEESYNDIKSLIEKAIE